MPNLSDYINYKHLIYSLNYHGLLSWMSDKSNVSLIYKLKTGKKLNLNSPRTFNEKLQWLKVFDQNPRYTTLVDKISAKELVAKLIGQEHIVPMLGQWNRPEDIEYDTLPISFVLKCNHDQGSVVLVKDKNSLDIEKTSKFLCSHLKRDNYFTTREPGYKGIHAKVFAEEYLGGNIKDYKFYCFNGVPKFLYVGQGLTVDHSLKIDYFDMDWKPMPFYRTDYERLGNVPKPEHFEEMKEIAVILSSGTPFVRIDLFEENDKVYFSEFTLCPASGFMPFVPKKYDRIVGEWLVLKRFDAKTGTYLEVHNDAV